MWWTATGCLGCLSLLVVLLGMLLPVAAPQAGEAATGHQRIATTKPLALLPPIEAFEPIMAQPLRRPLIDSVAAVAPTAAQPVVAPQAIPVSLAGTVGTSLAMLRTPDGQIFLCGVGGMLNGVKVIAIRPGSVDVRFRGVPVTLTKPADTNSDSIRSAASIPR